MVFGRHHPFLSPLGCLATIVLFGGMAVAVWLTGGQAFNPGPLTARAEDGQTIGGYKSHAEFENECSQCHSPLRGVEAARCENCHRDVRDERTSRSGLHGGLDPALVARCETCHRDHRGRDFNPSASALTNFNHDATGFTLVRHTKNYDGTPMECRACHGEAGFAVNETICADCHGAHDAAFMVEHTRTFGGDCLTCHDGSAGLANFDHTTVFVLDGAHAQAQCEACHVNRQFKGTPKDCVACHAEPQIHMGVFGTDCAACHTTTAWRPVALTNHTFPLDHGGQGEVPCATCHVCTGGSVTCPTTEYTCYGCHEHTPERILAKHREEGISGTRLEQCIECHPTGREEEGED